jgi:hypothetical protein
MKQGITLVPALGYQMVDDDQPDPCELLCATRTWGAPFAFMNKLSIFNPTELTESGFGAGRHMANRRATCVSHPAMS